MSVGFHEGELAVQRHAGVEALAARLVGMLDRPRLDGGPAKFLAQRDLAFLTARDDAGRMWTSPLFGTPGFLDATDATLTVHAGPEPGDPLRGVRPGERVGLLVIDFPVRRRFRINGTLTGVGDALTVAADEAFGNCPSYIHRRVLPRSSARPGSVRRTLSGEDRALIGRADTMILGTAHPDRGVDTSHRGGDTGFVRIDGDQLVWADLAGNNLFNSMGNIAVDPTASLLFADFDTGARLQLSGTAELEWHLPTGEGDTGRRVRFTPRWVASTPGS
jgi:predicted pyridoxine 5'-phosphate oxidase superfamily flavin-nucleotide-binding protein